MKCWIKTWKKKNGKGHRYLIVMNEAEAEKLIEIIGLLNYPERHGILIDIKQALRRKLRGY